MNDMMKFPNTVEEFMEQNKIVDTEQIYTNGAELVPIFRMKQWFDYIEGILSAGKDDELMNDDTIYRQAAIDVALRAISDLQGKDPNRDEYIVSEMKKIPSAQPIDVQEAYYRGRIDGVKECTAMIKKMNEEFANG